MVLGVGVATVMGVGGGRGCKIRTPKSLRNKMIPLSSNTGATKGKDTPVQDPR